MFLFTWSNISFIYCYGQKPFFLLLKVQIFDVYNWEIADGRFKDLLLFQIWIKLASIYVMDDQ